jgi:hypothetical protein
MQTPKLTAFIPPFDEAGTKELRSGLAYAHCKESLSRRASFSVFHIRVLDPVPG